MFDEPGQHAMSETRRKALVNLMCGLKHLQNILAASFSDESVVVLYRATEASHFILSSCRRSSLARCGTTARCS
jgi:hypothetical protein